MIKQANVRDRLPVVDFVMMESNAQRVNKTAMSKFIEQEDIIIMPTEFPELKTRNQRGRIISFDIRIIWIKGGSPLLLIFIANG